MKKLLAGIIFALVVFHLSTGQVSACSIGISPTLVNQATTIVFSGLHPNDNYNLEIGPLNYSAYKADNGGKISLPVTMINPGQFLVSARNVSGNPDTCNSTLTVLPATAPTGSDLKPPRDWLPWLSLPFGPKPFLGISFFQNNLVSFLVSLMLFLVILLSLIFIIVGGIMWMMGGGDKEAMAKAKNTVAYALVGLVLGIGSFIIVNILGNFFGTNLLGP